MKRGRWKASFMLALLTGISACTIDLPDLNPETAEGADIFIIDIFESIAFNGYDTYNDLEFPGFYREYDIWNNGSAGLIVEHDPAAEILFSLPGGNIEVAHGGLEFLPVAGYYTPIFLPVGGLTGGNIPGIWDSGNHGFLLMTEENFGLSGYDPPYYINPEFPVGISYVPIRLKTDGQFYYGWLEFFASNHSDTDPEDFVMISRLGLAETPGLRIRMGQE